MNNQYDYVDKYFEQYFGKYYVSEYKLNVPCKKSTFITTLRKIGDIKNQYVTNVYYLDTIYMSHDKCEVYLKDDIDYSPVYSSYHSYCEYCKAYKQNVKDNLIIGFKIYPKGVFPEKTYKQRKIEWAEFM